MNDSVLERITVEMKMESDDDIPLAPDFTIPIDVLTYDEPKSAFVVYKRHNNTCPTGTYILNVANGTAYFSNVLKFIVKDCDPNTGEADETGYEDEYLVISFWQD